MIRLLIFTFLLLLACKQQNVEENDNRGLTAEEEQIAKDLIQGAFDDLWGGVDSTKILDYHTADFIILEQGEVWDNARIKKYMRRQLADENRPVRKNRMEFLDIERYCESMQIAYYNYAEFLQADSLVGDARWLESALAVKGENGWRLKMMHSTWAGK